MLLDQFRPHLAHTEWGGRGRPGQGRRGREPGQGYTVAGAMVGMVIGGAIGAILGQRAGGILGLAVGLPGGGIVGGLAGAFVGDAIGKWRTARKPPTPPPPEDDSPLIK